MLKSKLAVARLQRGQRKAFDPTSKTMTDPQIYQFCSVVHNKKFQPAIG